MGRGLLDFPVSNGPFNLERIATGYAAETVHIRQDLSIAESQLCDYQARLGKPFLLETYLSELTKLRDQLKAKLSASGADSGEDRGPTNSELAERIKTLKAANNFEDMPQRSERKQSRAEEPITSRIQRRQETHPMSGQVGEQESATEVQQREFEDSFNKPPMTF